MLSCNLIPLVVIPTFEDICTWLGYGKESLANIDAKERKYFSTIPCKEDCSYLLEGPFERDYTMIQEILDTYLHVNRSIATTYL